MDEYAVMAYVLGGEKMKSTLMSIETLSTFPQELHSHSELEDRAELCNLSRFSA